MNEGGYFEYLDDMGYFEVSFEMHNIVTRYESLIHLSPALIQFTCIFGFVKILTSQFALLMIFLLLFPPIVMAFLHCLIVPFSLFETTK